MSAVKYFIEQNTRKLAIDEFLTKELNAAGYGGVEIRKMPMKTEVVINASRPGVVIGRRGAKIRELTYILENEFGLENVQVEVNEIENPWLDASVMASRLARQLERGVRFRRMAYWILRRVMRAGAIGCEIIVKGKLSSRRARYQKFKQGTIAKTGEPSDIFVDEADDRAVLKPGVIGIKVLIMRPDAKLPGVILIKPPKPRKPEEIELVKKAEEEKTPEEEEAMEEVLEGITNIDELRELEELDGLELVEDVTTPDESDAPTKEPDGTLVKKPEVLDDESDKSTDESIVDDLAELDSMEKEDAE
ncbi:MAG: 30S ribosomal protein S3 [Candidatus Thorarchaeota archaeon]|nr:30S ribosomal protein S3 [Candidatus Thorarchaeota archaeon]